MGRIFIHQAVISVSHSYSYVLSHLSLAITCKFVISWGQEVQEFRFQTSSSFLKDFTIVYKLPKLNFLHKILRGEEQSLWHIHNISCPWRSRPLNKQGIFSSTCTNADEKKINILIFFLIWERLRIYLFSPNLKERNLKHDLRPKISAWR